MSFQPQIIEGLHAGQSVNMFKAFDKFFPNISTHKIQLLEILNDGQQINILEDNL